jgi:hypothetical protein
MFITKHLSYLWSFLSYWKDFHDNGWAKWKFTIFVGFQQQRRKNKMSLFKEEKNIYSPLFSNLIFSSFFACFEQFKKLWKRHLKLYKTFFKCKGNKATSKNPKLQNTNCSYVPNHMWAYLTHPFIDLRYFCFFGCNRWGAIKSFLAPKATYQCTKIYKSLSLSYQHVYPSSCN